MMELRLQLNADEMRRVEHARNLGVDVEKLLKAVVIALPPASFNVRSADSAENNAPNATADLFQKWAETDATDNPQEIQKRNMDYEELKSALNENRRANGERLLFP